MKESQDQSEVNRRAFLKSTSVAAFMAMMGGVELTAPPAAAAPRGEGGDVPLTDKPPVPAVKFGVIGAGVWGRKIISTLHKLPNDPQFKNASVVAVCDNNAGSLKQAAGLVPGVQSFDNYQKLLANPEVQAVIVATPTHLHRQIVEDALQAGKHVYCEMPLAGSIPDAKAIARAAQSAFKQFFQAGLVERSHPQRVFILSFIRAGALGRKAFVRAQWHRKTSWRKPAATEARAKELNWRLDPATSTGLMGEACINLLDSVPWFMGGPKLGGRPSVVTGYSSIVLWNDGRAMPDTVQCVFEFPEGPNAGVRFICDATLCNSFDSEYEMYYGSDAAILMQPGNDHRESKAWMFKEVDAASWGWEGYAIKEAFGAEVGTSLSVNASKQASLAAKNPASDASSAIEPIQYALQSFMANAGNLAADVKGYDEDIGAADTPGYRAHLADVRKYNLSQFPAAGWEDGLEATVLAIKANEAAINRQRIELKKEFFDL